MTPPTLDQSLPSVLTDGVSTLHGITWQDFQDLVEKLGRSGNRTKLFYLRGVVEIVSPIGSVHENIKRTLNLLLEAYMREEGIRFYAFGGFTIEAPETASGIPDDSYCIGTAKPIPDIVIEVIVTGVCHLCALTLNPSPNVGRGTLKSCSPSPKVGEKGLGMRANAVTCKSDMLPIVTSGRLDKREIYRPHNIPEVWFWNRGSLVIYQLQEGRYESVSHSRFFPKLNPQQLIPYLNSPDQYDAVLSFTHEVRKGNI